MVLPWLQGVLLVQVSPAASVQQVAISTLAMLGLYSVVRMVISPRALAAEAAGNGYAPYERDEPGVA